MEAIDFSSSYLTWRSDSNAIQPKTQSSKPRYTLNNARIPIDCRCEIVEKATGKTREFVLGGNCKTERVGAEQDIWSFPNADFVPVFSMNQFMMIKTFDRVGKSVPLYPPSLGQQPERQVGRVEESFASVRIDLARREGTLLEEAEEVVKAALANRQLVARSEYENERYSVVLDYPIKTINANERDNFFQTDTGPVMLPDLTRGPVDLIGGFELAFSAFSAPDWTEFIIRTPTPLTDEISVYHYSRPLRLDTQNQIVQL
jgi:hypothetical protein